MALVAVIFASLAMAPAYLISRRYAGLQWNIGAYFAGFVLTLAVAAIAISQVADFKRPTNLHTVTEKLVYGAAENVFSTFGGVFLGPLGAGAVAGFQSFGTTYDEEAAKTPNDKDGAYRRALERATVDFTLFKTQGGTVGMPPPVVGIIVDSAVILPIAAIWWGRRKRLKGANLRKASEGAN